MPEGSIASAGAGISTPSQGSVLGDLATGAGGFLQGVVQERMRQEEEALKKAGLALEARRVDISQRNLDFQRERLSSEEERFADRLEFDEEQAEFARDVQRRLEERQDRQERELGQSASRMLVERYGYPQEMVRGLDERALEAELSHAQRMEQLRLQQESTVFSMGVEALLTNNQRLRENRQLALQEYQQQLENFQTWEESGLQGLGPEGQRQILDAEVGPERDQLLEEFYSQARPEDYQLLQQSRQRVMNLNEGMDENQELLGGVIEELRFRVNQRGAGMPRIGPGGNAGNLSQTDPWNQQTPRAQAEYINFMKDLIQRAPMEAVQQIEQWQRVGAPIDEILSELNMTMEDMLEIEQQARQGAAQVAPAPGSPSGGPSLYQHNPVEEQRAEERRSLSGVIRTGSMSEAFEAARRLQSRGLMSKEEILNTLPDHRMRLRKFLDQRLQTRVPSGL